MLKNTRRKAKTWEEFRKAMTTMPLSDLHEEVADIAKHDSFYVEVVALRTCTTRLTPNMARMALQSRVMSTPTSNRTPMPQTTPPSTLPPRYANQAPGLCTPMQNKLMPDDNHQASPMNPFRSTPSTNRGLFPSPTIGTNMTPPAKTWNRTNDPFANWDRHNPYPKTTEGKAVYEATIQVWWDRNGFNARATTADLIPLTPGTVPVGTRDCYACGWNDHGNIHFPHQSKDCTIMPKIPTKKRSWRAYCSTQA